jgi:hypothetical protein
MASVSRRQALIRTAAAGASADWLPALLAKLHAYPHAYPLDMPAGCQTYPVRALIAQDFPGTNDLLFQLLDAKLVKLQFQCSTITRGAIRWRTLQSIRAGLSRCSTVRHSGPADNRQLGGSG